MAATVATVNQVMCKREIFFIVQKSFVVIMENSHDVAPPVSNTAFKIQAAPGKFRSWNVAVIIRSENNQPSSRVS